jgi:hypothetical protein
LAANSVFLLSDRNEVIVTLPSFEWDFSPGDVLLRSENQELPFRQFGSGNHEGRPTVTLSPLVPWRDVDNFFQRLGRGTVSIVRCSTSKNQ